jgi:hypothetical protein
MKTIKAPGRKNIYKKSLAIELIKRGHNFLYSTRNRANEKYQVYVFEESAEFIQDLLAVTKQQRIQQQLNMVV